MPLAPDCKGSSTLGVVGVVTAPTAAAKSIPLSANSKLTPPPITMGNGCTTGAVPLGVTKVLPNADTAPAGFSGAGGKFSGAGADVNKINCSAYSGLAALGPLTPPGTSVANSRRLVPRNPWEIFPYDVENETPKTEINTNNATTNFHDEMFVFFTGTDSISSPF